MHATRLHLPFSNMSGTNFLFKELEYSLYKVPAVYSSQILYYTLLRLIKCTGVHLDALLIVQCSLFCSPGSVKADYILSMHSSVSLEHMKMHLTDLFNSSNINLDVNMSAFQSSVISAIDEGTCKKRRSFSMLVMIIFAYFRRCSVIVSKYGMLRSITALYFYVTRHRL